MHRMSEIDRYLTEIPLFSACRKRELRTVLGLTTVLTIPAGKVVTSEGQPGREFAVILEGKATVSIKGTEVATLGRGDFLARSPCLDGGPRTATVVGRPFGGPGDLLCRVLPDVDDAPPWP